MTRTSCTGKPASGAVGQHLLDAFLHRRDELRGNDAALHRVDELEAAAARQRLDPQEHLAELAGAAGLLLVPVVTLGGGGDGLAIGHARRPRVDLELVLLAMRSRVARRCSSPRPRSTVSLRCGSCSTLQGRILRRQLVQGVGQALLVAASLRRIARPCIGDRELQRPHVDVVLVVGIVQHAVELDLVDLRDGGDVARDARSISTWSLPCSRNRWPTLNGLRPLADEELGVLCVTVPWCTRKTPSLPTKGSMTILKTCASTCLRRVGLGTELDDVGTFALVEQRRVAFGRIRQQLREHVEQLRDARAVARRDEADGNEVTIAQRLLERGVQLFRRDLALFQVQRHQRPRRPPPPDRPARDGLRPPRGNPLRPPG